MQKNGTSGRKKLAENKTWQIRYRGPLGRALEKFCRNRLAEMDFEHLLAPYRERNGHLCGNEVMLWGLVVNCAIQFLPYLDDVEELSAKLRRSVEEMMALQDKDGCISAFPRHLQLQGVDLPGRRYVLNALLRAAAMPGADEKIKECCCRMTDQIISLVDSGKRSIIYCGVQGGLDASAILDSVVGVYKLTGEKRFLDFACSIVESGCSQQHDIFRAFQSGMAPCMLGNGNAVGLTDCFRGVAELCKADPGSAARFKEMCQLYMERINAEELFITGAGGGGNSAGTLWFRGAFHQTEENCAGLTMGSNQVTTACLEFFDAMTALIDPLQPFALAERSFYNAFLGAWNGENLCWDHLEPVPLTTTRRQASGEATCLFDLLRGGEALARFPRMAMVPIENGAVLNFYEEMEAQIPRKARIRITGGYPGSTKAHISIKSRTPFTISMRIPDYCTGVYYLDSLLSWQKNSYLTITRPWEPDEVLTLEFDSKVRAHFPPDGSPYQAFTRGGVVLAADNRMSLVDDPMTLLWRNKLAFVDYASAGKPAGCGVKFNLWFKKMLPKYVFNYFDYD